MRKRFSRPSPAMMVACVALFVALGGTAAAVKIKSSKIKNGAVTTKKIKNLAVTEKKLDTGAVSKDKLGKHAVVGSKISQGAINSGKIDNNAVTGDKVLDGSLKLAKVAQVVADASPDPPLIAAGACGAAPNVSVAGIQSGDSLLVLPKPGTGSDANLAPLAGQVDPASGQVRVVFCNSSGSGIDAPAQPIKIAVFR